MFLVAAFSGDSNAHVAGTLTVAHRGLSVHSSPMTGPVDLTLEDLCAAAMRLSSALEAAGDEAAGAILRGAVEAPAEPAELLLLVRSALVRTRPQWEALDGSLVAEARAAVAAGKRLAIEM